MSLQVSTCLWFAAPVVQVQRAKLEFNDYLQF